ncbi:MAG: vanadium-dependent haloperoxidase [Chloroflexaceae bacterium]
MKDRRQQALAIRQYAAELAAARLHPVHRSNGDEHRHRCENGRPSYIGNFTKCLPHDCEGFLQDPYDYEAWVLAIDSGDPRDIRRLRLGPGPFQASGDSQYIEVDTKFKPVLDWAHTYEDPPEVRAWESQGAGLTFDLQGPDAQAVTMPPAPSLDSQELIAEMGEVYWMARCRDVAFADWASNPCINAARESLKRLWWFRRDRTQQLDGATDGLPESLARRRILSEDGVQSVPMTKLFRGVAPGEQVGPYLSQFLLIGNTGINNAQDIADGMITYGSLRVDQRVRFATPKQDYMQTWPEWLDVQNGANVGGRESYAAPAYRFIATPRDLATYVHYDALYEAYLNACLILLDLKAPVDPGLPFELKDYRDKQQGFAQFGGPHILTLVTEVATRALKAVRYQKFNVHRRLRPEGVGGWMYQRRQGNDLIRSRLQVLENMEAALDGSSGIGAMLNELNEMPDNWLLPMAFPEGSPAHPSYGAGHGTVAGACVTILKAWFDHGWNLVHNGSPIAYESRIDYKSNESALHDVSATLNRPLTVEGELNKLAANISIGRNWAGMHYYSDYYESFRLGEQIAIGLLEEQKLTYGENFSMIVPLFDGSVVRI